MTTPQLSVQERLDLIKQVGNSKNGGEIVTDEDLLTLLNEKKTFIAYDGFEPSGTIHIAQGLLRVININKMVKAGAHFKMLVADWHAWANNKMGGDLEKIKVVGEYFIEVWKAAGLNDKNVEFIWASDLVKDDNYWKIVMNVARANTVKRIIRTSQIMGRSESDELSAAQILYPCMQCADVFYLGIDVCQLGMDQRKVNMLAREVAQSLGFKKPVAVHHGMMMGLEIPAYKVGTLELFREAVNEKESERIDALEKLKSHIEGKPADFTLFDFLTAEMNASRPPYTALKSKLHSLIATYRLNHAETKIPEGHDFKKIVNELYAEYQLIRQQSLKMSKSNPASAIFMTDTPQQVTDKMKKAYCPEGIATENPVLEYFKQILFELNDSITIERPEKYGGNLTFNSYAELEAAFVDKKVHPMDVKACAAKYVNLALAPVQAHFTANERAKQLLAKVQSYTVTR